MIHVSEEQGFTKVWKETLDPFYKPPSRRTIMTELIRTKFESEIKVV